MSVRRVTDGPPLERSNTPNWNRPPLARGASIRTPVIPSEIFTRNQGVRKEGDFVRPLRLNEPFLIANGIDYATVKDLASLDLEDMYLQLMQGRGYVSVSTRMLDNKPVRGVLFPYKDFSATDLYNSIAGVELTGGDATDKRDVLTGFTVSWFEYFYAEAGAQVFEDAMANQAAARPFWMWARHSAHSSSSTSTSATIASSRSLHASRCASTHTQWSATSTASRRPYWAASTFSMTWTLSHSKRGTTTGSPSGH